jgi:hypothetical protein
VRSSLKFIINTTRKSRSSITLSLVSPWRLHYSHCRTMALSRRFIMIRRSVSVVEVSLKKYVYKMAKVPPSLVLIRLKL